jgi:FSR family fosmidomycin resistance protein-like MFS transporter
MSSMSSYFTFYLMHKFGLSIQDSQFHLFLFLASVAAGTLIGGPLGIVLDENTLFGYPF